jgi:hypothetical protein
VPRRNEGAGRRGPARGLGGGRGQGLRPPVPANVTLEGRAEATVTLARVGRANVTLDRRAPLNVTFARQAAGAPRPRPRPSAPPAGGILREQLGPHLAQCLRDHSAEVSVAGRQQAKCHSHDRASVLGGRVWLAGYETAGTLLSLA